MPYLHYRPLFLFLTVLCLGLGLDIWSKNVVFSTLGMPGEYQLQEQPELHAVYWIVDGFFGFQTSLNEGALFGMGQGYTLFFAGCAVCALIGISTWLYFFCSPRSLILPVLFGMLSAGILGNLYDRLGLHRLIWNYADQHHEFGEPVYAVRDWILFKFGTYIWPNFNIADSLLVCGSILLILYTFLQKEPQEQAKSEGDTPPLV
ncbi:MAG: signal peptidase II [Thermoguttaceae bacterium]